jgi:PAS domain S-box-containing protein
METCYSTATRGMANFLNLSDLLRDFRKRRSAGPILRHIGIFLALVLVLYVTGRFGQELLKHPPSPTAFWAPAGISVAALILLGNWVWPAIFVASLLVNFSDSQSIADSIGVSTGNTIQAVLGTYLVRRYADGAKAFFRPATVLCFVLLAAVLPVVFGATCGTFFMYREGHVSPAGLLSDWLIWWLADCLAIIVVAPFLIQLFGDHQHSPDWIESLEAGTLLLGLSAVCVVVFGPPTLLWTRGSSMVFLCIPFLIWAAFRFCPLEVAGTNMILSGFAMWGSINGMGPFAMHRDSPVLMASFVAVICTMTMMMSAEVIQRRQVEAEFLGLQSLWQATLEKQSGELRSLVDDLQTEVMERIEVERELGESDCRVAAWRDQSGEVLWLLDAKTEEILYVSPSYETIWGRSRQSLYADPHSWIDAVHPEDHDRAMVFFGKGYPKEKVDIEYRVVRPDGSIRLIRDQGYVIRDEADRVIRLMGMAVDITNKVRQPKKLPVNELKTETKDRSPRSLNDKK